MNKEQLSKILELFKKFMPKEVSTANEKNMAMYRAYHLIKQFQPLSGDEEKDKEIEKGNQAIKENCDLRKEIERLKGLIGKAWNRSYDLSRDALEIDGGYYKYETFSAFKSENNL